MLDVFFAETGLTVNGIRPETETAGGTDLATTGGGQTTEGASSCPGVCIYQTLLRHEENSWLEVSCFRGGVNLQRKFLPA